MAAQIKLSTKSFGRDAAEVAAEAIANVAGSLVDMDMSDVIAGRPEAEALDALRIMSAALSRLQLRWIPALLGRLGSLTADKSPFASGWNNLEVRLHISELRLFGR